MYGYIYMIMNKINGKKYVGQHKSSKFCHQDKYMGSGKKLACAKKHYGIENFEKLLVQYVETREEANKQEEFWISHYDTTNPEKGYNIAKGGEGGYWGQGFKKGHKLINGGNTGHHFRHTEETKQKISESNKGKTYVHSKEQNEKQSKIMRKKYSSGEIVVWNKENTGGTHKGKKVQNIETGEIYETVLLASKSINISSAAVIQSIKKGNKAGGFHWGYINECL